MAGDREAGLIEVESPHKGPLQYNTQTEQLLRQEPLQFFRKLALDNLGITNMISSEFAVVNKTLARTTGSLPRSETRLRCCPCPRTLGAEAYWAWAPS